MMNLETIFPLIKDISDLYRLYRRRGMSREEACQYVIKENEKELQDADDGPQVWIGLAKITGSKNELTEELLARAETSFDALEKAFPDIKNELLKARMKICDISLIGNESPYPKKKYFRPDWQVGDTFIVQLESKEPPLENKVILLRKIEEQLDCNDNYEQIFYLTICDQDHLPTNDHELNALSYIPGHYQDKQYGFRLSITVGSRKGLDAFQLTKLGNFPDIHYPMMENKDDIPYPIIAYRGRNTGFLDHYVYWNYRRFGIRY